MSTHPARQREGEPQQPGSWCLHHRPQAEGEETTVPGGHGPRPPRRPEAPDSTKPCTQTLHALFPARAVPCTHCSLHAQTRRDPHSRHSRRRQQLDSDELCKCPVLVLRPAVTRDDAVTTHPQVCVDVPPSRQGLGVSPFGGPLAEGSREEPWHQRDTCSFPPPTHNCSALSPQLSPDSLRDLRSWSTDVPPSPPHAGGSS